MKRYTAFNESIVKCQAAEEIDDSWRRELGGERKQIGDFACFAAYMTDISNG